MITEINCQCDWCHGPIKKGTQMSALPKGWGHAKCADFAWDRYWSSWDRLKP